MLPAGFEHGLADELTHELRHSAPFVENLSRDILIFSWTLCKFVGNIRDMATRTLQANPLPELLTAPQLARYLGVPLSTVYHWRSKREGPPGFRVGKRLQFRAADVAAWLEAKESASA
jgi:excisionase family DNA binding protein